MTSADASEVLLLEEISLGSARGGKKPQQPLEVQVIRELTEEDLPAVLESTALVPVQTVKALRASHHRLAELLAKGTSQVEVSAITGYSQSYISNIKRDPAFAELMAYYETQKQSIFVDSMERLKALGLNSVEELMTRLEEKPEEFTPRLLMELTELALIKPISAKMPQQGPVGNGAPLVEIKFVGAAPRDEAYAAGSVVDVTPRKG